jgi:uncharacterized protein YecE (DUF72 family)
LIRVGTAGWSYTDWVGIVYPTRAPRGFDRLSWMASVFDTNEINSTFYRVPSPRMTRDWARRVAHNPRFAFTAKLYRGFTHEREAAEEDRRAFLEAMQPLADEERLGCVLAQFPQSFHNTAENRDLLARVLDRFASLPLAAEFRHRSWDSPEAVALLAERGAAFVNIDQPRFKDTLPATNHVTSDVAYYRFHGRHWEKWFGPDTSNEERYNYLYSEKELEPWATRIREGDEKAAARGEGGRTGGGAYAILNNHFRGQAVANAVDLQKALLGRSVPLPESMLATYPALASKAVPAGGSQPPLFQRT